jgi:hypothetical protein
MGEFILSTSSAIVEDIKSLRDTKSALIAYYYFNYSDGAKNTLHGLLSSLVMQFGDDSLLCWDVLHKLYTKYRNGSEQPTDVALAECLEGMLELPGQMPIYIIVDALDECPDTNGTPSTRRTVLDFVKHLVERRHPNLHVCVTSRVEQDIQATLNPLVSHSRRVSLDKETGQREDINNYIRWFVQSNESMRIWSPQDKELVIDTLIKKASGT